MLWKIYFSNLGTIIIYAPSCCSSTPNSSHRQTWNAKQTRRPWEKSNKTRIWRKSATTLNFGTCAFLVLNSILRHSSSANDSLLMYYHGACLAQAFTNGVSNPYDETPKVVGLRESCADSSLSSHSSYSSWIYTSNIYEQVSDSFLSPQSSVNFKMLSWTFTVKAMGSPSHTPLVKVLCFITRELESPI